MEGFAKRVDLSNTANPGGSTNILATALGPKDGVYRITVCLASAVTFSVMEQLGAGAVQTLTLNNGAALTSNAVFTFIVGCSAASTYNFQLGGSGATIVKLQVDEVWTGVF